MHLALEWINSAAEHWWGYVFQASWQAALVGVVLLTVVQIFGRRWPAPLRYALLVVALIKFAFPPMLPVPTGLFSQFAFTATHERKPPQATTLPSLHRAGAEASGLEPLNTDYPAALTGMRTIHSAGASFPWMALLMTVHAAGAVMVAVLVCRRAGKLRALSRASRARLDAALGEQYRNLAIELEVYRIPPLAISDQVEAPMAVGVPRPAIMLPSRIVGSLSATDMKAVLAHELAHCHRGDLWLNWVQLTLLAVWWFHPVVWLVNRGLREVREDCCDDLLLSRRMVSNDDYCDALLRAASQLCPNARLSAALGFSSPVHPLGRRMVRIMDWTLRRSENVSPLGAMAVLLGAALLLPGLRTSDVAAIPAPALASVPEVEPAVQTEETKPAVVEIPRKPNPTLVETRAKVKAGRVAAAQRALLAGRSAAKPAAVLGATAQGSATAPGTLIGERQDGFEASARTGESVRAQPRDTAPSAGPFRPPLKVRPATPGILEASSTAGTVRVVQVHYVSGWPAAGYRTWRTTFHAEARASR